MNRKPQPALQAGDRIRVRRYIVPSLEWYPENQDPAHDNTGTIRQITGRRIYLDEVTGGFFDPGDVFLGGDPRGGTCRWLVTDVQLLTTHDPEGRPGQ